MFFIWWNEKTYFEKILLILIIGGISWLISKVLFGFNNPFLYVLAIPFYIVGIILLLPFILAWWLFQGVLFLLILGAVLSLLYAFLIALGINFWGNRR